jgi:hypothetical protein
MLRRSLLAAAPALLFATQASAQAAPINWGSILIYQAEILEQVMPQEQALMEYIDRLQAAAEGQARADVTMRSAGVMFVALAPDGRHQVWLLETTGRLLPNTRERWESALSAVPGVPTPGYFLFGIAFGAGGAAAYEAGGAPPIPAAWEAQIPAGGAMLDNAFIARVWPPQG